MPTRSMRMRRKAIPVRDMTIHRMNIRQTVASIAITTAMTIFTVTPMLTTTSKPPPGEGLDRMNESEAAALYRLMTWLSPSFPVGAFSYSSGIEWAVESGDIADAASLSDWLGAMLAEGSGFCDGVFLAQAHRAASSREANATLKPPRKAAPLSMPRVRRGMASD